MIRTVLYLYIILLVVTSGLLLSKDGQGQPILQGTNSIRVYSFLDSSVNSFFAGGVGATGDVNGLVSSATLAKTGTFLDFAGFFNTIKDAGLGLFSVFVFLAVGSADLINVLDPSHTWGLIIIAPIALIQLSGFVFLLIEIIAALRGGST